MDIRELDYELPDELIAQRPLAERDAARLLVLESRRLAHRRIRELPNLLPRSLIVVNDTRVFPARLRGRKRTGGQVELLLLERLDEPGGEERWLALGRGVGKLREGAELLFDGGLEARVVGCRPEGRVEVRLTPRAHDTVSMALECAGEVPLPPYIRRVPGPDDRERYQTVFAERSGAVAAPTAGLHLSSPLLEALQREGHELTRVTLHVGPGTFQPVKTQQLDAHRMHSERYDIPEAAADAVARARHEVRPVTAVGTTVVRALESAANEDGTVRSGTDSTSLFIRPGFRFRVTDALVTNFHLPRSTLLALVMAFGGIEPVRSAYREAVRARYRFFSYGDAMLIRGDREADPSPDGAR